MSDSRVWALRRALYGLLSAVREQGQDVDELIEIVAYNFLERDVPVGSHSAEAIVELELAADALEWP